MEMCEIDTRAGPSSPEESNANNSVSIFISSNDLPYNLYSFTWESVHLEKSPLLKMACIE